MKFLAQIIGSLAVSIWVLSIQNKERKNILKFQAVANFLYIIEYALLGAYSAASMNFISTLRCIIFKEKEENSKWLIIFIILILLLGLLTYEKPISLIPVIITIFYTISSSKSNVKWNRIAVLASAFIWLYYNYKVGAYIVILGNILEIISGIVSLKRYINK